MEKIKIVCEDGEFLYDPVSGEALEITVKKVEDEAQMKKILAFFNRAADMDKKAQDNLPEARISRLEAQVAELVEARACGKECGGCKDG